MNTYKDNLLKRISDKSAYIGIVGLGYVGLPLVLGFAEVGFKVLGFDIDSQKIDSINSGQSYIKHIPGESVSEARTAGLIEATTDFSRASEVDTLILCVPTPLNKYREPDISFIIDTMESLLPYLRPGQVISLESTTYPGTTDEELQPRIESRGLTIGEDIFLLFSPEREDPGNQHFSTRTTPKVVGGTTPACLEVGQALYGAVINKVVPVSSTRAAELTKLLENIYRAINIGLVNEIKIVADRMNIDIWEVIDAASTKPFGFTPFYPGPGWGGHCIPIDPFYLTWKSREYGLSTHFIELAGEINTRMPEWVIQKMTDALNIQGKCLNGAKVLVAGIAYKKNIDDMRESPAVKLMELLRDKGAEISYVDPYVPVFPKMREHKFDLKSVEMSRDYLEQMDCVLIATDHDVFDYDFIQANSQMVVDTRGRYRGKYENVVKC